VTALAVIVDGTPLPDEEARAMWKRFSDHMDVHKGDLVGFAKAEGFASVHPEMHNGRAVLVASRSAPQRAYGNAPVLDRKRSDGRSGIQSDRKKLLKTDRKRQ
jgi:hypothetical protein